jgi:cytochrome c oxidase subunit IV
VKIGERYLWALCGFAWVLAAIYWAVTYEWTGTVLLVFLGFMPLIVAAWSTRHRLRVPPAPEDDPEADTGTAAGAAVGSFPLASAWPAFAVLGVIVVGASLVYGLIIAPAGAALLLWSILGFMRDSRS